MTKWWSIGLMAALAVTMLAACGGREAAPGAEESEAGEGFTSSVLDTSYPGALNLSSQLALGTMELEGTENAVTPEQAATLIPLWQALQGGVTVQPELNAVWAQIEATMTPAQLEAVAAMQLTQEDLAAWAERNGLTLPFPGGGPMEGDQGLSEEERAAIRATIEAGGGPPGGFGDGQEMTDEQRAAIRATIEAGGGPPGGFGGGQEMTDEQRAALRATAEAGGGRPGGGRAWGGGRRAVNMLVEPLIELLTERAAE